jgi:hypothetical protein
VVYGDNKFVAIARNSNQGAYSLNGIDWEPFTLPASRSWQDIAYGVDKFVTVAGSSNQGAYSLNGIDWEPFTLPASRDWEGQ